MNFPVVIPGLPARSRAEPGIGVFDTMSKRYEEQATGFRIAASPRPE